MKTFAALLCVSMLMFSVAPDVCADEGGKRRAAAMSADEDRELAARAAETPELADFEAGGSGGAILIALVLIGLIALIVVLLTNR